MGLGTQGEPLEKTEIDVECKSKSNFISPSRSLLGLIDREGERERERDRDMNIGRALEYCQSVRGVKKLQSSLVTCLSALRRFMRNPPNTVV